MKTVFYKQIIEEVASARPGVLELMDAAIADPNLKVRIHFIKHSHYPECWSSSTPLLLLSNTSTSNHLSTISILLLSVLTQQNYHHL
jgi:hypothetical protein